MSEEKRTLVKIVKSKEGLEASLCLDASNLKEIMALDKALGVLRTKMRESVSEKLGEMVGKDLSSKLNKEGSESVVGALNEIKDKLKTMDEEQVKQFVKDMKGMVNNC